MMNLQSADSNISASMSAVVNSAVTLAVNVAVNFMMAVQNSMAVVQSTTMLLLQSEVSRALSAESLLSTAMSIQASNEKKNLTDSVQFEINRAIHSENLESAARVSGDNSALLTWSTALTSAVGSLTTDVSDRVSYDNRLSSAIFGESSERAIADNVLKSAISMETSRAMSTDQAIFGLLSANQAAEPDLIRNIAINVSSSMIEKSGSSQLTAGKSCLHLYNSGFRVSGLYWIGNTAFNVLPFQAYCDQTDGGGWMKFLQLVGKTYTTTQGAFGTIATTTISQTAKLSDANINYLSLFGENVFRISPLFAPSTMKVYMRTTNTYNDSAISFGILPPMPGLTGGFYGCENSEYMTCIWTLAAGTDLAYIDTYYATTFNGNNQAGTNSNIDRIMVDHQPWCPTNKPGPNCYNSNNPICGLSQRCFGSSSINSFGDNL